MVATLAQQQPECSFLRRQGLVQVDQAVTVGVFSSEDAGAAGAAGAGGEKGIVEAQAAGGQPVDIGRVYLGIAVGAQIIPAQVIGDQYHEIGFWPVRGGRG